MVHFHKLPKGALLDLLYNYSKYVQNSNETQQLPVGVESFYLKEYQVISKERARQQASAEAVEQAIKIGRATYREPDAQSPIAVFLSKIGSCDGKNNGTWLHLPASADNLRTALTRIGAKDGKFAVVAAKGMGNIFDNILSAATSLDEMNLLAHLLKKLDETERNKLDAILESGLAGVESVTGLINLLDDNNFKRFKTVAVYTGEELGRHCASVESANETASEGVTYEEYGRQYFSNFKNALTDKGFVYEAFVGLDLYNGIVPEEYRIIETATKTNIKTPQKSAEKPKTSVLAALDEGRGKVAQADADRAAQGVTPTPQRRNSQEQGD